MILRGLAIALLLAFVVPRPALAASLSLGTIEGQVTNGTAGGSSVGDVQVTLFATTADNATAHLTTKTDATGSFQFKDLKRDAGNSYVVGLSYQEAEYFSDAQSFSENETSKKVEITVYDATTDDSAISVVNAHTVVFVDAGALTIQELYVFANMSDRTYIGVADAAAGTRKTLRFSLPAGFTDLELGGDLSGAGIMATGTGFVDTGAVQPGAKQAYYSYKVPLKSGAFTYSRKIDYRTVKYSMLVQGDKVSVKSDNLTASGTTNMGTTVFTGVTGSNLAAGSTLTVRLSGLGTSSKSPPFLFIGLGAFVVVAAIVGLYLMRGRRRAPAAVGASEDQEERLLAEMADLDDDFESGKIAEVPYRAARAQIKAELVELERAKGAKAGG